MTGDTGCEGLVPAPGTELSPEELILLQVLPKPLLYKTAGNLIAAGLLPPDWRLVKVRCYADDLVARGLAERVPQPGLPSGYRLTPAGVTLREEIAYAQTQRPLFAIAADIKAHWHKLDLAAVPYIGAMEQLNLKTDTFGQTDGDSIIRFFLHNARSWRGEHARRIKAELREILGDDRKREVKQ